ncbi:MAG: hypothetical protein HY862_09920 [Chloroflexi bacterium]|nr:hypothetical protein [Chloroflexota bacterium]
MFEELERKLVMRIAKAAYEGIIPFPVDDVLTMLLCYRLEQQGYITIVSLEEYVDFDSPEGWITVPLKIGAILTALGTGYVAASSL